ncbi:hypothetical protein [Sediminibacterium sp.]|uniref:hypothetical protein n=1 Tax=Sediminibacterium sp. TaxID=1917865 RepID=UPI00272EFA3F|nr:hypothetical protein [Sediminibacterium sp.]MDP2420751.1 hypothetical protein [Sediminibacterium sp.]
MYFITEQDPNYSIKGSRDPLGFQVVWQAAGRRLIPYLSTVSKSIKDFQILCLAYALKNKLNIDDKQFEPFFLRFEQMMAYTRYRAYPEEGFNGVDKVRKIMSGNPASVRISSAIGDQLLSNQKAYGIWGKYNSPFTEMRLTEMSDFSNVYIPKVLNNEAFLRQVTLLSKKNDTQAAYIETERMDEWSELLQKPKGIEKKLFIEKLLDDTCGKELLNQIDNNPDIRDLNFFELIQALTDASSNSNFKSILAYISNTEKVISPLNRIFRYLQTKSYWKNNEIETDSNIKKWRSVFNSSGFDETTKALSSLLTLNNYDLVVGLVKRNEEVTAKRNSAAWMQLTDKGIEVNHFEGADFSKDYGPGKDNDFNYFFSTFTSLHKQLN